MNSQKKRYAPLSLALFSRRNKERFLFVYLRFLLTILLLFWYTLFFVFFFFTKVHPSKRINMSALYQYTIGNQSKMAELLKSEDGGKSAMRLANTLLSVVSAAPENEFKTEDKIKVRELHSFYLSVESDDPKGSIS